MADTKALRALIERGREAADIMAREWPGAELDGCIKELADALASLLDAEPVADIPAHPEDYEYAALLRNHDYKRTKWIVVPHGQSLDFDEGTAVRRWLHPHLGSEWHLFAFVSLRPVPAEAPAGWTEDDMWLLASAAENLRGGSQDPERRADAAFRIAFKLDELRKRMMSAAPRKGNTPEDAR